MAVCEIHIGSQTALHKMTSFTVILPEVGVGPFPVLYLLHGLSDDHTTWTRRTSIERHLQDLPLIVVMPNGERGWYTDAVNNSKSAIETYVTRDLVNFVDSRFQTIPTRAGRVIAGLSMGGYGAIKLALKHPDLFCAAISWSGALGIAHFPKRDAPEWQQEMEMIFGVSPQGGPEDPFALISKLAPTELPDLRIDCGTEDFLIEHNRQFHTLLESLSIPHEYLEKPGGHSWDYWDDGIKEAVPFLKKSLGLLPPTPPELETPVE